METPHGSPPQLGQMLLRNRLVTEEELARALAVHEESGTPIGEVLVELGIITSTALADALLRQTTWRPLGQLLLEKKMLREEELEAALEEQEATGRPLGEIVRKRHFISAAALGDLLAEQYELEREIERGFGNGLRRAINARHRNRRDEDEARKSAVAYEERSSDASPHGGGRVATLQAALEVREETIAVLGSANRTRAEEMEALRAELAEKDALIAELRMRIAELENGSPAQANGH